jgi:hypothetical protein
MKLQIERLNVATPANAVEQIERFENKEESGNQ